MSNTRYQDTTVNQFRRKTLLSGAAFLAVYVSAPASFASGGGGGGDGGERDNYTYSVPKLESKYTQKEFTQLSKKEISQFWGLSGKNKRGGKTVLIDGFSEPMTSRLVDMIYYDRSSTKRLIRDMGKIKDTEARKKRLSEEVKKINKRIADLEAALERAQKKNFRRAVNETKYRIRDAKGYLKAVKVWEQYPHEGTR